MEPYRARIVAGGGTGAFGYTFTYEVLTQPSPDSNLILYHDPDWLVIVTFVPFARLPIILLFVPGPLRTLRPVAALTVPVFSVVSEAGAVLMV